MNSKKWIKVFVMLSILGIGLVGAFNYIVDPGYVYFKRNSSISPDKYAETLFTSKNGLVASGWDERAIKLSMSKHAGDFDCLVLGSSHIMQISGIRNTGNIQKICPKLLNLGVSGGSLEDLFVFSDVILTNTSKPKKIFIGIDPWTLKFNMDVRYLTNQIYYDDFLKMLGETKATNKYSYELSLFKNLFNLEYFLISVKEIKSVFKERKIEIPSNQYTFEAGYREPLKLQDGSTLYDNSYIIKAKNDISTIKNGGGNYKIDGVVYDKKALLLFESLINFYQKSGVEVNFILTPYHQNVFNAGITKPVQHIEIIENLVHKLSEKYKIKVYGSFYSAKVGCKNNEFLDFMHASSKCLNRIDFSN